MGISSPRLTSYLIAAFAIIANIALLAILLTLLATDVVEEQLFKVRAIVKREVVISEDMVRYYAANPVVLTRNGVPVEHDDYDDMYGDCDTEDHASDDHDDNVNDVDDDDAYLDYGSKTWSLLVTTRRFGIYTKIRPTDIRSPLCGMCR